MSVKCWPAYSPQSSMSQLSLQAAAQTHSLDVSAKFQELQAIAAFLPFVVLGHPSRQVLSHALAMTTFSVGEDAAPLCCSTRRWN